MYYLQIILKKEKKSKYMNELKNSKCLVIGGGGFIGSFV